MNRQPLGFISGSAPKPAFPVPTDASAWWAFLSSSLGGLALVHFHSPARMREGLILVFAFACLFVASDWISSLSGKGLSGEVPRGQLRSLPGFILSALALACLAWFYQLQPQLDARLWMASLVCAAALTSLMFFLRLDLLPYDSRLLAFSSMLCTLPALFLSFLALGWHDVYSWYFWAAPALFFPVSTVFAWTWLQGLYHARRHLTLLAAPLMVLIVAALSESADLSALMLTAYLIYLIRRLQTRYRRGAEKLPEFSDIRKLGREQAAWNAAIVLSWLLNCAL